MIILRCGPVFEFPNSVKGDGLLSSDGFGHPMTLCGKALSYLLPISAANNPREIIEIDCVEYELAGEKTLSLEGFLTGGTYLINDAEETVGLKPEIAFAHAYASFFGVKESKLICREANVPSRRKYSVFLFDFNTERFCCEESSVTYPVLIDDSVYGWDRKQKQVVRMALDLSELWRSPVANNSFMHTSGSSRSRLPKKLGDSIVVYLGHSNDERVTVNDEQIRCYKNGLLHCYHQQNGALKWSREFDNSVEDLQVVENRLLVTSSSILWELDPDTGETLQSIETGLEGPDNFDRQTMSCLAEIHASGWYLYYLHWISGTVLVFDLRSLVLQHRIALPDGWRPHSVQFEDDQTGKLYVQLALGAGGPPDYHRSAMLELEPDNLDQKVEVERGPPTKIYMAPSTSNPEQEELWIEIETANLDDALRFGILHTQNHAYIHGRTLVSQHCDPNPKFNGQVHFRYFGSEKSRERTKDMLRILVESFNRWSSEVGVYAGDGSKELCQIDAQLNSGR